MPLTVVLKGEIPISIPVLQILLDLERRGFDIEVDASGLLIVNPWDALSPAEQQAIASHAPDLVRLVRYCDSQTVVEGK